MLLKNPLRDLPNEVFVVLGSSDEEPFDLVIRCVRAYFRALPPQLLVVSVVSHDHALLPSSRRTPLPLRWTCSTVFHIRSCNCAAFQGDALPKVTGGKRSEITSRQMRPPGVRIVSATGVGELLVEARQITPKQHCLPSMDASSKVSKGPIHGSSSTSACQ